MGWRLAVRTGALVGLGTLFASLAVAIAVAASATYAGFPLAVGGVGVAAYLAGATRLLPASLNVGLGLILAALIIGIVLSPSLQAPVLLQGALLYAAAELGWLGASPPPRLTAQMLLLRGLVLLGGLLAGYLSLFGEAFSLGGGPVLTVIGAGAAIGAFFLLRGRRQGTGPPPTSRSAPRSP